MFEERWRLFAPDVREKARRPSQGGCGTGNFAGDVPEPIRAEFHDIRLDWGSSPRQRQIASDRTDQFSGAHAADGWSESQREEAVG